VRERSLGLSFRIGHVVRIELGIAGRLEIPFLEHGGRAILPATTGQPDAAATEHQGPEPTKARHALPIKDAVKAPRTPAYWEHSRSPLPATCYLLPATCYPTNVRKALVAFVCVVALYSSGARAEPTRQDIARADALFREAPTLVQKGQLSEACAKYAESQRLDPANGTLLNLALCNEKQGRHAAAYRQLQELLRHVETGTSADDRERARIAQS